MANNDLIVNERQADLGSFMVVDSCLFEKKDK